MTAPAAAACLNCGTGLIDRFCHRCGQSAHVHRSLGSVGHDLLHGLFHFEGRVWRTLPMVLWRPGELTRRYVAGERARFVSPLALFLFGVLLLFAAVESVGPPLRPHPTITRNGQVITPERLHADLRADEAAIARLRALPPSPATARRLEATRDDLDGLRRIERVVRGIEHPTTMVGDLQTGWGGVDERVAAARANPALALVEIEANAHKFAWALIPLSVPFVWLMFWWRREVRLYDHVVFVTYSLAAATLLLVTMAVVASTGLETGWMLLLAPIHFFRQLRGAYRLGWWGALWRTAGLVVGAICSLGAFGLLVLWLGTGG